LQKRSVNDLSAVIDEVVRDWNNETDEGKATAPALLPILMRLLSSMMKAIGSSTASMVHRRRTSESTIGINCTMELRFGCAIC